jgi:hypothetical protein
LSISFTYRDLIRPSKEGRDHRVVVLMVRNYESFFSTFSFAQKSNM